MDASPVRLAHVLDSLALAIELGLGVPSETIHRTAVVSAGLGHGAGLDEEDGGESVEKLAGDLALKGGGGSVTADVVDLYTDKVTTSGTVAVDLTRVGHRTREVESFDGIVETQARTLYRAEVTVTFADGRQGTATCAAVATTSRVWIGPHAAI